MLQNLDVRFIGKKQLLELVKHKKTSLTEGVKAFVTE